MKKSSIIWIIIMSIGIAVDIAIIIKGMDNILIWIALFNCILGVIDILRISIRKCDANG